MNANGLPGTPKWQAEEPLERTDLTNDAQMPLVGGLSSRLPWFLTKNAIEQILLGSREATSVKEHWGTIVTVILFTICCSCVC
jgi:hypothetical protein